MMEPTATFRIICRVPRHCYVYRCTHMVLSGISCAIANWVLFSWWVGMIVLALECLFRGPVVIKGIQALLWDDYQWWTNRAGLVFPSARSWKEEVIFNSFLFMFGIMLLIVWLETPYHNPDKWFYVHTYGEVVGQMVGLWHLLPDGTWSKWPHAFRTREEAEEALALSSLTGWPIATNQGRG